MEKENIKIENKISDRLMKSKFIKPVIMIIALLVIILLTFHAGMIMGLRRASFSYSLGDNYYRNFGGQRPDLRKGMMNGGFGNNMMNGPFGNEMMPIGYGVSGKVIKINGGNIVVEGNDNIERIVITNKDTLIRQFRNTGTTTDIKIDDNIIVVGSPTQSGEITAKLIRILPIK